jgi:tRNA U34 5-methylaminomethyl-2-thiouridine-forming methyltransferase MnmC
MERNAVITADGSVTLFSSETGEHYHSVHGAIQESLHVFIGAGLKQLIQPAQINILEVGFGTGLNCLLTLAEPSTRDTETYYCGIEPKPLTGEEVLLLNYCWRGAYGEFAPLFEQMHSFSHGSRLLRQGFTLERVDTGIEQAMLKSGFFNLVYFDAFSAEVQPALWEPAVFQKIRAAMQVGGILVTYAAKGSVRRALQQSGFATNRLPGPPGKREMLQAVAC